MTIPVVLAVDDRPDNLFVIEQLMSEYCPECKVISVQSGEEGLAVARKTPIDVAVADVKMPGMDGVEMCRRLKSDDATEHVSVILLTAHTTTSEFRANALEAGADDFISKPIDGIEFAARIKTMLRIKKVEDLLRGEKDLLENLVQERTKSLREQNEFIRNTLESLTHPFYVIDANDYTIKMANSVALARHDSLPKNKTCYSFIHQNSDPCVKLGELCPLEEVKKTKKAVTVEHIHYDKDDNLRVYEIHGHPIIDNDGKVVQMIEYSLEITERKQAEEEVKKIAEYFENLVGSAGDAILSISHPDNTILSWNTGAEVMFGYTKEEVLWRNSEEFFPNRTIPPEHLDERNKKVEELIRYGKTVQFELGIIRKDGSRITSLATISPFRDRSGKIIGRTAIHKDITDRKQTENMLRSLKALNENVVQSIQEGLVALDRNFRINLWNKAMEEISGYAAEEVMGKVAFDVFPHLGEQEIDEFLKAGLEGHTAGRSNVPYQTPMGKTGYTNEKYLPLQNLEGEVIGVLCVVEDVTEALRREQELAHLQEEIRQRKLVEVAKGILMREVGLSEDEAYRLIQKKSQEENKKMVEVAVQVIEFFGSPKERRKFS